MFQVVVNLDTLDRSLGDPITGVIFVRHGDLLFPENCWSDFPIVILGWWGRELMGLIDGESDNARFQFMDGQFHVELEKSQNGLCHVSFVDEHGTGTCIHECEVTPQKIAGAIAEAGKKALA